MNFDDSFDTIDTCDDAADTLRFGRAALDLDGDAGPDATSIYDLGPESAREEESFFALDAADATVTAHYLGRSRRSVARHRLIRATRQDIEDLRDAIEAGWDVGPELAHEERRLAALVAADRR